MAWIVAGRAEACSQCGSPALGAGGGGVARRRRRSRRGSRPAAPSWRGVPWMPPWCSWMCGPRLEAARGALGAQGHPRAAAAAHGWRRGVCCSVRNAMKVHDTQAPPQGPAFDCTLHLASEVARATSSLRLSALITFPQCPAPQSRSPGDPAGPGPAAGDATVHQLRSLSRRGLPQPPCVPRALAEVRCHQPAAQPAAASPPPPVPPPPQPTAAPAALPTSPLIPALHLAAAAHPGP